MSDNVINKINIGGSTYDIIGVPDGGTAGQILTKNSETDYDVSWEDAEGGITPITYSELVTLKAGGNLVPGMQYRITDYHTTVYDPNDYTRSADHQFDVIVRADDESHLNENASAIQHEGDTYFSDSDLSAWKLKYQLNNIRWSNHKVITEQEHNLTYSKIDSVVVNGTTYILWEGSILATLYSLPYLVSEYDTIGSELKSYDIGTGEITDSFTSTISSVSGADGNGTITMLIDEFNNQCPYDFKNIQFKRWKATDLHQGRIGLNNNYVGIYNSNTADIQVGDPGNFIWAYTFSDRYAEGTTQTKDNSIKVIGSSLYSHDNIIGELKHGSSETTAGYEGCLNNIVLYGWCYSNVFDTDCYDNTLIECSYNTFGNRFYGNCIGEACVLNSFGENCCNNSFGGHMNEETYLYESCQYNTVGNDFKENSICGTFTYNSIGNQCRGNKFGENCQYITVFDGVQFCNITGGTSSAPVKNAQILNGTKGTSSSSRLTITFEPTNKDYTQVAGLVNETDLRIWIAEDTVTGPSSSTNNNIALFDGTSGKIIKDSGITISDLSPDLCTSTTYSALKTLRDGGNLVPGMQYRITDYTCTTTQTNTSSAGHIFDIIVTADDTSTLNENARAAHHSGDTYYQNCNLEAWELKYTIDNDTDRFGWANSTNGKGIVYWMKDENRNEACYDFTNILFNNKYTFNNSGADARLNSTANIHDNIIGPHYDGYATSGSQQYYTIAPNNIVFEGLMNYDNTFGEECYDLTFSKMTIGNEFDGFTWDCSFGTQTLYNKFGSYCTGNVFPNKFATSTVESHCWYMNVTSTTNYTRCHILGGIQGTSTSNRLNVPITETHQYAGLNSSGVLKTWIPADLIQ